MVLDWIRSGGMESTTAQREINIDRTRTRPFKDALVDVLYRETHIRTADMKETMSNIHQRVIDDGTRIGLDKTFGNTGRSIQHINEQDKVSGN